MIRYSTKQRRAYVAVAVFSVLAVALCLGSLQGIFDFFVRNREAQKLKRQLASQQLLKPEEAIEGFCPEAVVLLAYLGRQQQGAVAEWAKVGFVIGDGRLIVTAAHCVESFGDLRNQAVSSEILVISPHYGDVFNVDILAVDEKSDVAILKADWPSHPALQLAERDEIENAEEMLVAGYRQENDKNPPFRYHSELCMERLRVGRIDEAYPARAILLKATRYVRPGWSGSAIVLPQSGKVAGVLGRLMVTKTKKGVLTRRDSAGCSVQSVKTLLEKHDLTRHIEEPAATLARIEGAEEMFSAAAE